MRIYIFFFFYYWFGFSQVGINTINPHSSSMLEISSLDKGLLIPRISLTATNNSSPISSPSISLLIYNTATVGSGITAVSPGYYYWEGSQWLKLSTSVASTGAPSWELSGNSDTNSSTNFIGTTDNVDVRFKRNNRYSGNIGVSSTSFGHYSLDPLLNTGGNNTAIGSYNLYNNTSGNRNTSVGANIMTNNTTGSFNVAFGVSNMISNTSGNNNVSIGYVSLFDNTTGSFNIAIGSSALRSNINANNNIAIGYASMNLNTTGSGNVALGTETLSANTIGFNNTAVGYYAMDTNTTGQFNTGVGNSASYLNTTGSRNVALGEDALYQNSTGNLNVAVGSDAGFSVTGSNNIIIGANTNLPSNSGNNQIRIGDANISYAGTQVAWSVTSDKRWKKNIENSNLGIDFIMQIRPVSYVRTNDVNEKIEYGFIAQEINEVLNTFNLSKTGIITKDDSGFLSVRYNDLLAPIVKSIQELSVQIEKLKKENQELKNSMIKK